MASSLGRRASTWGGGDAAALSPAHQKQTQSSEGASRSATAFTNGEASAERATPNQPARGEATGGGAAAVAAGSAAASGASVGGVCASSSTPCARILGESTSSGEKAAPCGGTIAMLLRSLVADLTDPGASPHAACGGCELHGATPAAEREGATGAAAATSA